MLVDYVVQQFQVSLRRACRVVGISDYVYRYQPDIHRDDAIIAACSDVMDASAPTFGNLCQT